MARTGMNLPNTLREDKPDAFGAPLPTALRLAALCNGVVLVAIACVIDLWVLPYLYTSFLDAEIEPFAIGYVLYYRITPSALIAGTVIGVWYSKRLERYANPERLFL